MYHQYVDELKRKDFFFQIGGKMTGPYDLDLKKGVDFGLKNSIYLDLNSFALSNFDLKPKLCQQCT